MIYGLSFSDNTLILISESTPLLIKIAEKQWILTNNHIISIALQINEWYTDSYLESKSIEFSFGQIGRNQRRI